MAPALGTARECGPPQRGGEPAAALRSPVTRPLYIALWVPNGLIVGCESLFVPYGHAGSGGHGAVAGWLFAATAAGMMAGDLLVGRFVPPSVA